MRIFFIVFVLCLNIYSQNSNDSFNYYFSQLNKDLNESIPKPHEIIGHNVGDWHISHDKLVQYMYTLSESSDRITIENRGKTFEGRPLILLTITSEKNHSNIDEIISNHQKITKSDENINIEKEPIVVYQGFSIHGNEASGSNASILLAYYLAASKSSFVTDLLNEAVILLDPSLNPDGLQRLSLIHI